MGSNVFTLYTTCKEHLINNPSSYDMLNIKHFGSSFNIKVTASNSSGSEAISSIGKHKLFLGHSRLQNTVPQWLHMELFTQKTCHIRSCHHYPSQNLKWKLQFNYSIQMKLERLRYNQCRSPIRICIAFYALLLDDTNRRFLKCI